MNDTPKSPYRPTAQTRFGTASPEFQEFVQSAQGIAGSGRQSQVAEELAKLRATAENLRTHICELHERLMPVMDQSKGPGGGKESTPDCTLVPLADGIRTTRKEIQDRVSALHHILDCLEL